MRLSSRVTRRFRLAGAAILTRIARLGKNVVPLLWVWRHRAFAGVRSQLVDRSGENRCFERFREIVVYVCHIVVSPSFFFDGVYLRLIVKSMNPGEIAFRD
jgi:hypothetical protein